MSTQRKGARSLKDIPTDILEDLNEGLLESANLMEWLAVDQLYLLRKTLAKEKREHYFKAIDHAVKQLKKPTISAKNAAIGQSLCIQALAADDLEWLLGLLFHASDSVRCWICYSISMHPDWSVSEKFEHIQIAAQDHHFGVREVAWMAMRHHIIEHLDLSLEILQIWAQHENANIRRFASEATRPCGVWCTHITVLKQHPEKALSLLTYLAQDPSKYVQNSVGNWLNDAGKSAPDFVINLCKQWRELGQTSTNYMIKRALRNLNASNS